MTTDKNAKIRASLQATRLKRSKQEAITRELKINECSLKKEQREALQLVFLEAKWVYNHLVTSDDWKNWDTKSKTVPVRLFSGEYENRELTILGSQVKQKIVKQIESSIKTLSALKKNGKKVGALRPKSSYNSIQFIQKGTTWDLKAKKIRLQGLPGWYRVNGVEQLDGLELASAKLIQKPSGYYLKVTGFREPEVRVTNGLKVGLDFGIKTHITTSEGVEYSATIGETERLKRLQRKLQRQQRGSNNRRLTLHKLNQEYEKLGNRKDNLANKIVSELLAYDEVVLQDENLTGWKVWFGRTIQHSVLGRVKSKLIGKGATVIGRFEPTTQFCPNCEKLNRLGLSERVYNCACGYSKPRDLHAAQNMLLFSERLSPKELGVAPVDRMATSRKSKSSRVEAGNETTQETVAETRLSSAVA